MDGFADINTLYTAYRSRLYAYFLAKYISPAQAEDFVQDVFVKYQSARYEVEDHRARALLFQIANNVFFDHLRRLRTQRHHGLSAEQMSELDHAHQGQDDSVDIARALEAKQDLHAVIALLQDLPPKCRDVFIDFRFANLSQKEIATRRGIGLSMVEKHVATALKKLKTALER
ncbi:RNA polymerase sigma factor [Woodsholea maritima]|uniref:RNA polymerase sigma factor n=1 Tax=Woodsholea maritima TaxID=240237 RepID=UPI0003701893|nr:RNA polymerase sigma factor [Woodsholea maritima]